MGRIGVFIMLNNQVSIDRITVSGNIKKQYQELQNIANYLGIDWQLENGAFRLMRNYDNGDTENVGYFVENSYQRNSWRLDFNPNKLADEEKDEMIRAVNLLTEIHFTRLDVAFDVFNNELGMKHRIYRPNVSEREYGLFKGQWQKDIQTIYYGSPSSEQQIRQYNKLVEQQKKQMPIPDEISSWMRLELQLTGRKPIEWVERAKLMLDDFRLPDFDKIENMNDKIALFALENDVIDWSDFSNKNKKARLRKLQKEKYDNTLANELLELLIKNELRLQKELKKYLVDFGIEK